MSAMARRVATISEATVENQGRRTDTESDESDMTQVKMADKA
jgi:hypothetical protein